MKTFIAFALGICSVASANATYNITLNTAPLIGNAAGPFSIDFQLIGNLGTIALMDGFDFGIGNPAGTANCNGFCSGDLTGSVQLTADPSGFYNEFYQAFAPGASLSFTLHLSNVTVDVTPDEFSFAILDQNLDEIPMLTGNGSFVTIDLTDPDSPSVSTYENDPGSGIGSLGTVTVTQVGSSATPEPSTLGLIGLSLVGLALLGKRERRER